MISYYLERYKQNSAFRAKTFRREVWVVKDLYFAMLLRLYRHWRLKFLEQMIKMSE